MLSFPFVDYNIIPTCEVRKWFVLLGSTQIDTIRSLRRLYSVGKKSVIGLNFELYFRKRYSFMGIINEIPLFVKYRRDRASNSHSAFSGFVCSTVSSNDL